VSSNLKAPTADELKLLRKKWMKVGGMLNELQDSNIVDEKHKYKRGYEKRSRKKEAMGILAAMKVKFRRSMTDLHFIPRSGCFLIFLITRGNQAVLIDVDNVIVETVNVELLKVMGVCVFRCGNG